MGKVNSRLKCGESQNLHTIFQLPGIMPLTPELFSGQLYLGNSYGLYTWKTVALKGHSKSCPRSSDEKLVLKFLSQVETKSLQL